MKLLAFVISMLFSGFPLAGRGADGAAETPAEKIGGLIPGLSSATPDKVSQAGAQLERLCFEAGKPGAEDARKAVCIAIAAKLGPEVPVSARIHLVAAVEKIGRGEVIPALGKLLSPDTDPILRETARRALEANPHVNAKRELRSALREAQGTFRIGIINSLGVRRDFLATADLMEAAEDKDAEVRLAALNSLALIGDLSVVPAFESALKAFQGKDLARVQSSYLRLADSLARQNERGAARRIYEKAMSMGPSFRAAALTGFARAGLKMEIERIVGALDDPDHRVRGGALEASALMPGPEMTKAIVGKLGALEDPASRIQLLCVLARRDDKDAMASLLEAARAETSAEVRSAAIRFLWSADEEGPSGPPRDPRDVLPVLLGALAQAGEPAAAAEEALSRYPDAAVTTGVAAALGTAGGEAQRGALVRILGARRDGKGLDAVKSAATDASPAVRAEAVKALGLLGDASVVPLLLGAARSAQATERDAAVVALSRLQGPEVSQQLLSALESEKGAARPALLRILGSRKEPKVLPFLKAAATDADPAVKLAGIEGLASSSDASVLPLLMEAAQNGAPEVQRAAVKGCLRFADALAAEKREDAAKIYLKALEVAAGDEELQVALRGMGEVGGPEALEKIAAFLKPGPLQREAGRAALRIAERLPAGRQAEAKEIYQRILTLDVDDATATQCVRRLRRLGIDIDFAHEAGFVTAWWMLGPIPNPDGGLWEKDLGLEKKVDLAGAFRHGDKTFQWVYYHNPNPRGLLNLDEIEGYGASSCVACLYAEVTVADAADALFKIGSDDQVAFWLNGAKVHANKVNRGLSPDQDTVEVKLSKGSNGVLIKVFNDSGPWGACLRITDRSGKPLDFKQRMP